MKNNPFTLTFGKVPQFYIPRPIECQKIISDFNKDPISTQAYLITGVRGSGKTSLLNYVSSVLSESDDWITISLNPERDMLLSLAAKLYEKGNSKHLFLKSSFSLSVYGISFSIDKEPPIVEPESVIEKILTEFKKRKIKVLITIDEVTNSQKIKEFAHTFQSLAGQNMLIYLLMTGLYENIRSIQNNQSLTFLYRAQIIDLKPLNLNDIALSYQNILKVNREDSIILAKLTNGYAFAYQVLGYLLCEKDKPLVDEKLLSEYDEYLTKYVYEKIYEDTPNSERKILFNINKEGINTKELLEKTKLPNNEYSVYRSRLIKKGILQSNNHGFIEFTLPRFYEFLRLMEEFA